MNNFKKELIIKNFDKNSDFEFKAKVNFCGEDYYVIDAFTYKDIKYLYIVKDILKEIDEAGGIENYNGEIELEYIYETEDDIYSNVTDKDMLVELNGKLEQRFIDGKI